MTTDVSAQVKELIRSLELRRVRQAKSLEETDAQINAAREMLVAQEAKSPQARVPGSAK